MNDTSPPGLDQPQSVPTLAASDLERLRLKWSLLNGSRWFYWVAGLSGVNTIIGLFGGTFGFLFGLGVTQLLDGIGIAIQEDVGTIGRAVFLGIEIFVLLFFAAIGFLGGKRQTWAMGLGMLFYTGDALISAVFGDYIGAAFHAFVLFQMFQGLRSGLKLANLESAVGSGDITLRSIVR